MNRIMLIGNLYKEPELRYTPGGLAIAKLKLAVGRPMSAEAKREAEANHKQTADFFDVVTTGAQAENASKYLKKGSKISVEGTVRTGTYTTSNGDKRYTTEVKAELIEYLTPRSQEPAAELYEADIPDEEVPF